MHFTVRVHVTQATAPPSERSPTSSTVRALFSATTMATLNLMSRWTCKASLTNHGKCLRSTTLCIPRSRCLPRSAVLASQNEKKRTRATVPGAQLGNPTQAMASPISQARWCKFR